THPVRPTARHKYVHFSPSGIAPGGCFPRARPQPPRENHSAGSSDSCYSRRSHHPPLTRTSVVVQRNFLITKKLMISKPIPAKEIHEDSLKKKTAFSACDVSQRSFPCPAGKVAMVFGGASNRSPRVSLRRTIVRVGSRVTRGKRSVFPERVYAPAKTSFQVTS